MNGRIDVQQVIGAFSASNLALWRMKWIVPLFEFSVHEDELSVSFAPDIFKSDEWTPLMSVLVFGFEDWNMKICDFWSVPSDDNELLPLYES